MKDCEFLSNNSEVLIAKKKSFLPSLSECFAAENHHIQKKMLFMVLSFFPKIIKQK